MRPAPTRTARLLPLLLVVAALVAGCVSIPASGPVVTGRTLDGNTREPRRSFYASGPSSGDSPVAIVDGFLRAAADFSRDHSVARSFLTPDQQKTWRPTTPVVVYDSAPSRLEIRQTEVLTSATAAAAVPPPAPAAAAPSGSPSPSSEPAPEPVPGARVTVEVEVPVLARIGEGGIHTPTAPGEVQVLAFYLTAVGGQWRITNPADGVVISRSDFQYTFADVPLYFRDRTGSYLVPDIRWFPVTSAPSVVVDALLDGPVGWLNAAVTTGAPSGTALTATGVRSDGDTLVVDLTIRAKEGAPEQRRVLLAQLQATLREASRSLYFVADDVRVTVEEARFEVPSAATAPALPGIADADLRPVALDQDNRINRVLATRGSPVPDLPALPGDVSRPAASPDGATYAVLTDQRTRLVTMSSAAAPRVVLRDVGLTAPSFDVHGWLWTSPQANTGVVYAVSPSAAPTAGGQDSLLRVAAPWLRGYQVTTLRISREGARALVVAGHQGRSLAYVCGVVRDENGVPASLTDPPLQLVRDLVTAQDASWLGADEVSVLGVRLGGGERRVWVSQVGGDVIEGIPLPDAVSITTRESPDALWVQTRSGAAYRSGAALLPMPGLRWPAVPG